MYSGLTSIDRSCYGCCDSCDSIEGLQSNQACNALNMSQGESKLIKQLCNCSVDAKHWCFVHNRVLKK